MQLTSLTKEDCRPINTLSRQAILPPMRLNWNMPDAVIFGTMSHGGMEFPEAYTLQDQLQILDIMRHLRWDKTVANDILFTLDNIQLNTGFVTPIFQGTSIRMNYVGQGQLVSLRERMREIKVNMWTEDAWGA